MINRYVKKYVNKFDQNLKEFRYIMVHVLPKLSIYIILEYIINFPLKIRISKDVVGIIKICK